MDLREKTRSALECLRSGNLRQAEHAFKEILALQPDNVTALHFIGVIYYQLKKYDSSIKYIKKALQLGPDYVDAYNNLGIVLHEVGRFDEAVECYQKAIELNPDFARAHYNLGTVLREQWKIGEALSHYRKAVMLNPHLVEAYNNIGLSLQDQGRLDEAEEHFRHALRLRPDFALCFSNLLLMLNYNSRHDAQSVFGEHLRFARQVAERFYPAVLRHANDPSPSRKLKIGYVSPDFRRHSVNYFIEPVLASHNHEHFEVFCYSDVPIPDTVTERLHRYADQWRNIKGMSDEVVSGLVRDDGIDILVDLAGHTGYNRMLLFARKPAPVQLSWLGYPNTTGLRTVDYRIVDGYTDPRGLTDPFYSERLIRLPEIFLCYLPDKDSPPVRGLPVEKLGYITFGSFNYFPKVSEEAAACWSSVLKVLPGSRLLMKARNFADPATCRYAKDMFVKNGIAAERIETLAIKLSFEEHLDMYSRVDIALDTFPYNGTTTTCEALWMGVPVVSLVGETHASRVGMSVLTNMGLSQLIARTRGEYISAAVTLAADIQKLKSIRQGLRDRMARSPLMDANKFTLNLESKYREMWQNWCMKRPKEIAADGHREIN